MIQKRLIIKGRVQNVGYRALIRAIAVELDIKGVVKNLTDDTVEIICQCETKKQLQQFIGKITIEKKGFYSLPYVKSIASFDLEKKENFSSFVAEQGKYQKEMLTKLDVGGLRMYDMQEGLSSKIKNMHNDMTDRFDDMERNYGSIGESLKELVSIFKTYDIKMMPKKKK